jgi:hypothetical protein
MTSRPILFLAALTLTIVNAFIVTGAIVSTFYGYRVATFAVEELWTYKAPHVVPSVRAHRVRPGVPVVRHAARVHKV